MAKVLVANKCDRPDKVIESERGKALADQHGLSFFETSAKTGLNVAEVFQHIAKIVIRDKVENGSTKNGVNGNGTGAKNFMGPKGIKMGESKENVKSADGGCCK